MAVQSIIWTGRAGALHLQDNNVNIYAIGVHGGHAEFLADSLSDVAKLASHRPYGAQLLVMGDFNVDQLPVQPWDPWAQQDQRNQHHARERRWLEAMTQACNCTLYLPGCVSEAPSGQWANLCRNTGITRVPVGGQAGLPSVLDYAAATPGCIARIWGTWEGTCSDHAMIIIETKQTLEKRRWRRTTWKCKSTLQCKKWMSEHGPSSQLGQPEIAAWLLKAQQKWEDGKSSAQRSQARVPEEVKQLWSQATHCSSEEEGFQIREMAKEVLKQHILQTKLDQLEVNARRGQAPVPKKTLHELSHLLLSEEWNGMREEWQAPVQKHYVAKWGGNDLQQRLNVLDLCLSHEGMEMDISPEDIVVAAKQLNRVDVKDSDNVAARAWLLWAESCPAQSCAWLRRVLASTPDMKQFSIVGKVKGKRGQKSALEDLRAILPLTAALQVADAIISSRLNTWIDSKLPTPAGAFVAARPRTQATEVMLGCHLVMEKALDNRSQGCLAQADVASHYDTLCSVRITRWLLKSGCEPSLAIAALRFQLLPEVILQSGSMQCCIQNRSCGSLTGSRTAGAWGRIPVEATLAKRNSEWQHLGFETCEGRLTMQTYVDNVYVAGESAEAAAIIVEDFGKHLQADWQQKLKASSMEILIPKGGSKDGVNVQRWHIVEHMNVLGNMMQHNGECNEAWGKAKHEARRRWFSNCCVKKASRLSATARLALVNKCLKPFLHYRMASMPFGKDRAAQLRRLQRWLVEQSLRVQKTVEEDVVAFVRRRHRLATKVMADKTWDVVWAKNTCALHEHVQRNTCSRLWACQLVKTRNMQWLARLKQTREMLGAKNSRSTGMRIGRGHVPVKYEQGVSEV